MHMIDTFFTIFVIFSLLIYVQSFSFRPRRFPHKAVPDPPASGCMPDRFSHWRSRNIHSCLLISPSGFVACALEPDVWTHSPSCPELVGDFTHVHFTRSQKTRISNRLALENILQNSACIANIFLFIIFFMASCSTPFSFSTGSISQTGPSSI
jgi:hypothetical protein